LPFIADAMLGKLARWLRILGFDTAYEPSLSDDGLILKAKEEGRALLTRDIALHKKASRDGVKSYLIREKENISLLKEVAPLLIEPSPGSRCPACNLPLTLNPPRELDLLVTGYEGRNWRCPSCGKLYWHGSHWKGIRRTLLLAGLGDAIGNS
jgi:uncharacterized protein with PIN domain